MTFPYTPLDASQAQIRVLVISPPAPLEAGATPHLRCIVKIVSLDDRPHFAALSYVWGDPAITRTILVDGIEVAITQNLYDALLWISQQQQQKQRHQLDGLPIWADAICINQQDLAEKSVQISLMSRIYKEAGKVVCWLGPSTPRMDTYLRRRSPGLARPVTASSVKRAVPWAAFFIKSWCRGRSTMAAVLECLEIIGGQTEFLHVTYFSRMWTFQEALIPEAGRTVFVLGGAVQDLDPRRTDVITCPSFALAIMADLVSQDPAKLNAMEARAVAEFNTPSVALADSAIGKAVWRHMWLEEESEGNSKDSPPRPIQLWEILLATVDRACYDPRDKVFALLGLLKERNSTFPTQGGEELLAVDYTKTPEQVVLDALYYIYKYEAPALVLFVCTQYAPRRQARQGTHAQSPSWLPDMTVPRSTVYSRPKLAGEMLEDGTIQWSRGTGGGPDTVKIIARRIGRVSHVYSFPGTTAEIILKAAQIVQQASAKQTTSRSPDAASYPEEIYNAVSQLEAVESLPKRLSHTFIGNVDKNMPLATAAAVEGLRLWDRFKTVVQMDQPVSSLTPELRKDLEHAETIATNLRGRALIVLGDGGFGLCADTAEVGDDIILSGAFRNCVLLRRVKRGREDIMDGQSVVQRREDDTYLLVDCVVMNALSAWSSLDESLVSTLSRTGLEEFVII